MGKRTAPATEPLSADELLRAQAEASALLPDDPSSSTQGDADAGDSPPASAPAEPVALPGRPLSAVGRDVGACLRLGYVGVQLLRTVKSDDFEPDRERARTLSADAGMRIAPFVSPGADRWLRWLGFGASFGADLLDGELRIALERRKARRAQEEADRRANADQRAPSAPYVVPDAGVAR